ncbi:tetratricopeptide repeat protein [Variovorax dokdonensis]|uniref:Tetratricopeptide repeat protein n=1 Tax=Variovorax dokdonensis TaxID=344883 RepID=A0ABT7NGS6_9BURK|nr:tetratricopeptide repeat protein [Variovorax dokdonensis]
MTSATASLDSTHPYTLRGIMQMLGLSRHSVERLVAMGFVRPQRAPGAGRPWRFSFRDVVLLRTAQELRNARIPTRQLLRSLQRLQQALPHEAPADALRIKAVGDRVAVRWGGAQWDAETGQLLMDFAEGAGSATGSIRTLERPQPRKNPTQTAPAPESVAEQAQALYEQAEALEEADPAAAVRLYWRVVRLLPTHADAYANLGYLLCESGRFAQALALYAQGVACCPRAPLLHYNRAVALEALGKLPEAIASYEASLALDPTLADAHQNLALIHDRLGNKQRAIRHFNACRRLSPQA